MDVKENGRSAPAKGAKAAGSSRASARAAAKKLGTVALEILDRAKRQGYTSIEEMERGLSEDASPEDMDELFIHINELKVPVFDTEKEGRDHAVAAISIFA